MSTADNFNDIYYSLKYEADLLFTRFVSFKPCMLLKLLRWFCKQMSWRHLESIEKCTYGKINCRYWSWNGVFVIMYSTSQHMLYSPDKWRIAPSHVLVHVYSLLQKGFESDSVWDQIGAVTWGAWNYWTSSQLHFPGESQQPHRHGFNLWYRKTLHGNNLHNLLSVVCQIQNLGYFPVKDLQLNIEIPEMTKNGNQLLQISDFHIDQVSVEPQSERQS